MARLLDSVPPEVKRISPSETARAWATRSRARSRAARAARPGPWTLEGLPGKLSRAAAKASRTSGRRGLVALWSR